VTVPVTVPVIKMAPTQQGGAKKMRLMVDSEYEQFMGQNLPKPHPYVVGGSEPRSSGGAVNRVTQPEMEVLKSKSLGDDQKWKIIQEQLHRMIEQTRDQQKRPLKVQIQAEEEGDSESSASAVKNSDTGSVSVRLPSFISRFMVKQRPKAQNLFGYLKNIDEIFWDTSGKVFIGGEDIEGSHIATLVKYALVPSGRKPVGWDEFCDLLRFVKAPLTLFGPAARKYFVPPAAVKKKKKKGGRGSSPSPHPDSTTPVAARSTRKSRAELIQNQDAAAEIKQEGEGRRGRTKRGGKKRGKTSKKKKTTCKAARRRKGACKRSNKGTAAKRIRWKAFG
jgi:hypothetical protein